MKSWKFAVSAAVLLVVFASFGICWKATNSLLFPEADAVPSKPDLPIRDVAFKSPDGVELKGWFVPPVSCLNDGELCVPARGVVLSHGRSESRGAFVDQLPMFHRAGFAVLAFDYRGCGESDKAPATIGGKEQDDLLAAVGFAQQLQSVADEPVGVVGRSMGASVAVMAAARDQRIGAVVEDSGFAKLKDVVSYNFKREAGLPSFPFAPLTVALAEKRADVDVDAIDPAAVVSKISPRPLLVIHGTADDRVKFEQGEKLFAAALEPKEFWRIDGIGHVKAFEHSPDEYERRVIGFLKTHLS